MMLPVLELPVGLSGMCGSMHVFPTGILSRCNQPSRLCLQSVTKLHQAEVIPSPAPLLNRTCYTGEGTEAATAPIPFTAQLEQPPTECSEGRAPARAVLGTGNRTGRALCCPPARSLRSQDTPHLSLPDRNTQTRLWLQHRLSKCRNNLRQAVQTDREERCPWLLSASSPRWHSLPPGWRNVTTESTDSGVTPAPSQWAGPGSRKGLKHTSHLLLGTRKEKRVIGFQSHPDAQSERLINNK